MYGVLYESTVYFSDKPILLIVKKTNGNLHYKRNVERFK